MNIADAFQLVIELAKENALSEREASVDPGQLGPEMNKQQEAINIVEDFVVNNFGDD